MCSQVSLWSLIGSWAVRRGVNYKAEGEAADVGRVEEKNVREKERERKLLKKKCIGFLLFQTVVTKCWAPLWEAFVESIRRTSCPTNVWKSSCPYSESIRQLYSKHFRADWLLQVKEGKKSNTKQIFLKKNLSWAEGEGPAADTLEIQLYPLLVAPITIVLLNKKAIEFKFLI